MGFKKQIGFSLIELVVALAVLSVVLSLDDNELNKSHRKQVLKNAGIPTTPTVVFPTTGEPGVNVGVETLDVKIDQTKTRSFWQEHVDDNS